MGEDMHQVEVPGPRHRYARAWPRVRLGCRHRCPSAWLLRDAMTQELILFLFRSLEERLVKVFFGDARKYALVAQTAITADIYLAALYQSFPGEVARYFRSSEPLANLAGELSRVDKGVMEIEPMRSPRDPARMLNVKIDGLLLRALYQAARLVPRPGKSHIELADFMHSLTLDEEIMNDLREKRNLIAAPPSER